MKKRINAKTLEKRKKRALQIAQELRKLFPDSRVFLRHKTSWELLVAIILSAQCTDKKVNEVTARLFKKYKKLDDYLSAKQKVFERDIYETGFYRTKAKNILSAAKIIKKDFGGKIPKTMDEMLTISGVGRKTANIALQNVHNVIVGIPVDTHVKRLSRLLGLTYETDPNKIEQDLMEIFPKKEWASLSYRLIEYGRKHCPARKHDHENCPLSRIELSL